MNTKSLRTRVPGTSFLVLEIRSYCTYALVLEIRSLIHCACNIKFVRHFHSLTSHLVLKERVKE